MGFFEGLFSSIVPGAFKPDQGPGKVGQKWVEQQQNGCGIAVYSQYGKVQRLFYEVLSCTVDRTTTDLAGSFTFMLAPTQPWDELLEADDYVRIFMGDQVVQSKVPPSAYNFAAGPIDHQKSGATSVVFTPLPGSGWNYVTDEGVKYKQTKNHKYLIMYERFIGKIDRVERVTDGPTPDTGNTIGYNVTGRSLASIIQDISLYYNEWLPGLNAVNIFFGTSVKLNATPSEFVRQVLAVILSAVPLPQYQLPKRLVDDLNFNGIASENAELANKYLNQFRQKISSAAGQNTSAAGLTNALVELNRLVQESANNPSATPFSVLSIRGIKETFGQTFNASFLQSQSTGFYDLVKQLSNEPWNEFYFDLCPGGYVDGGSNTSSVAVPTIVMRQRPYNITSTMLENTSDHLKKYKDKHSRYFDSVGIEGVSNDLFNLDNNSITVFGRQQQTDVRKYLESLNSSALSNRVFLAGNFSNMEMQYQCGYSSHDRINAFLTLGQYNRGNAVQTDRIAMSQNGGFVVDPDSIRRFGFRIMELSTIYAQPDDKKAQQKSYAEILKTFSKTLANWYFMNPGFLNGRIVCRFLPDARLGIPCKYFQTRVTPDSPYPKMEMFYVQGVTDTYRFGQPLTTTLTVIRGIRYRLASAAELSKAVSKLTTVRDRVRGFFG